MPQADKCVLTAILNDSQVLSSRVEKDGQIDRIESIALVISISHCMSLSEMTVVAITLE